MTIVKPQAKKTAETKVLDAVRFCERENQATAEAI
jgi:hypothetical protein